MHIYSSINNDSEMFDLKDTVNYHNDITNYVSVEEMVAYMFAVLEEYDRCMLKKQEAEINPMSGRVMMRMKNGLSFELPENVQKFAIAKYLEMKEKKRNENNIEGFNGFEEFKFENNELVNENDKKYNNNDDYDDYDNNDNNYNQKSYLDNQNNKKPSYNFTKKLFLKIKNKKVFMLVKIALVFLLIFAIYKYYNEINRPNF
jgi:hypothetical protein